MINYLTKKHSEEDEVFTVDEGATQNPFKKRLTIPRTPPPARKSMMEELEKISSTNRSMSFSGRNKREREENSWENEYLECTSNYGRLQQTIDALMALVIANNKTKVEIKEKVKELKLHSERVNRNLKKIGEIKRTTTVEDKKKSVDSATQTEGQVNWRKPLSNDDIAQISTYEDYSSRKNMIWKEFKNVKVKVGNPINTNDNLALTIVDPSDPNMTKSIQKMFTDRHPDLLEINEEMGSLEITSSYTVSGEKKIKKKNITKVKPRDVNEDLWRLLAKVRQYAIDNGHNAITTHVITSIKEEELQKMLQSIFCKTDINITICKPVETQHGVVAERQIKQNKEFETEAIEISKKGADYSEVLRGVQNSLEGTELTKGIKTIRSTKKGTLLVILDKMVAEKETLKKVIIEKLPQTRVRDLSGNTEGRQSVFIREMDATVTKDEVLAALKKDLTSEEISAMTIGEVRPSRSNTATVTISATPDVAKKLLTKKTLRVGLSQGNIEERYNVVKCFKCWGYGHRAAECLNPDRSNNCYKCGQEGHKAADCKGEEQCPLCKKKGHKAGGVGCNDRRRAVRRARMGSIASQREEATDNKEDPTKKQTEKH